MTPHRICNVYPPMSGEDYAALKESIKSQGLQRAIVLYEGQILDGKHRLKACEELGIEPRFEEFEDDDPVDFVVAEHTRRNLTESQRALVAARLANLGQGRPDKTRTDAGLTTEEAAKSQGVGKRVVEQARRVLRERPHVEENIADGTVTVGEVDKSIREEKRKQRPRPERKTQPVLPVDPETTARNAVRDAVDGVGRSVAVLDETLHQVEQEHGHDATAFDVKTLQKAVQDLQRMISDQRAVLAAA